MFLNITVTFLYLLRCTFFRRCFQILWLFTFILCIAHNRLRKNLLLFGYFTKGFAGYNAYLLVSITPIWKDRWQIIVCSCFVVLYTFLFYDKPRGTLWGNADRYFDIVVAVKFILLGLPILLANQHSFSQTSIIERQLQFLVDPAVKWIINHR